MKRILIAIGTRPEAIKLCPILPALREKGVETVVCSTGQHTKLLEEALKDYGVEPQIAFRAMEAGQPLTDLFAKLTKGLGEAIRSAKPDCVMVQGDTATALAGALAAFYENIPVAHVEAGLRTHQIKSPFPEEMQRRSITLLSDYHFAPTAISKRNLLSEGIDESRVHLVGNTVIDALRFSQSHPVTPEWDLPPRLFPILFTAHRRENFGGTMKGMFRALRRIVEGHDNVFAICPLHANPKVREAAKVLEGCERIRVIDPPGPVRFHALLSRCRLVMTDSGGIQEEVTSLGIPTVVMRYSTERVEGVRAGCLMLSGTHEDGIVCAVNALLRPNSELYEQMSHPSDVFGDGKAAERIAAVLAQA